jgi:hypothetical protein
MRSVPLQRKDLAMVDLHDMARALGTHVEAAGDIIASALADGAGENMAPSVPTGKEAALKVFAP